MEAIVMAAGEGTRLRPLTERWPKAILPIDGRAVIATLLRELRAAGAERATIVSGHLAERLERLVGDGSAFGLEVRYARQPQAVGSADAVSRALAAGATPPLLLSAADTVYTPGDVAAFAKRFGLSGGAGALAVRRRPPPGPGKRPVRIEDGWVTRVVDDDPGNPLSSAPLWAMGPALIPFLERLPGPPFELAAAFQRAIAAGERIAGIEIGPTRDLTFPVDLVRENFPYLADE